MASTKKSPKKPAPAKAHDKNIFVSVRNACAHALKEESAAHSSIVAMLCAAIKKVGVLAVEGAPVFDLNIVHPVKRDAVYLLRIRLNHERPELLFKGVAGTGLPVIAIPAEQVLQQLSHADTDRLIGIVQYLLEAKHGVTNLNPMHA